MKKDLWLYNHRSFDKSEEQNFRFA